MSKRSYTATQTKIRTSNLDYDELTAAAYDSVQYVEQP